MKAKLLMIVAILLLVTPGLVNADGCFFHHYHEDIYEPNQKAIIFYNESCFLETLILQVKYEGNVSDFGWVVPTPTVPELNETDGDIFYELSVLTSEDGYDGRKGFLDTPGENGNVTLIKQEQVGIYNASVLNATDASALLHWVQEHGYAIPSGIEDAIQYYIGKGWCFTAIKIDIPAYIKNKLETYQAIDERIKNLSDAEKYLIQDLIDDIMAKKSYNESIASKLGIPKENYDEMKDTGEPRVAYVEWIIKSIVRVEDTENLLRSGEIQPIVFIFESEEPVYPLKITSINGHPTEVLIYMFANDKQTAIHYDFSIEYSGLIKPADIAHFDVLSEYVDEPLYLTKLRAVISAEEMDRDVNFAIYEASIFSEVPGFQVMVLIIAIATILFLNLKRKQTHE